MFDDDQHRPRIAAETPGRFDPSGHALLSRAVDTLVTVPVDELDEPQIHTQLELLETAIRQLQARQGELAGTLATRQTARAQQANPRDYRAGERARREVGQQLADRLHWAPGRAKRTLDTQRQLDRLPAARDAARAGRLPTEHAKVLADTLNHLLGEQRATLEAELVASAADLDPVSFGRRCRRRLAELDPDAALRDLDRRHARRSARLAAHPDGTTTLYASLTGLDAETLATAIDAFRTPDRPHDPPRSPEQRTADALVSVARAALDHGLDTTAHGQRPHIQVRIDWTDLTAGTGTGETVWTGPVPTAEIRRLLDDATISRLVTGPDSLPLDIGRTSRTIPTGVWRAVVARDRHCTWPGCDAPPGWCDAAHLDRRWRDGAGVSTTELALACRHHHRTIDRRNLTGRIDHNRVTWHPPDG